MATKPVHLPVLHRRSRYSNHKKYRDYREEIQEDCQHRCVYCDIHELEAGGAKNMTLDHFRPRKLYPNLVNDPSNLLWSCSPCNGLKGNDWPAGANNGTTINGGYGYIDPFAIDRKDYFQIGDDGRFIPLKDPAQWMIDWLALNRPFLRYVRHRRDLVYEGLLTLEKHFTTEIEMFDAVLKNPDLSDTEKLQWVQDRDKLIALLEVVLALDEALSLT